MNKIKHFILPKETNDLYQKEANSSISLTKEVANKINEIVDTLNDAYSTNYEKELEQDGKIRKGIIFMKDNLANSIIDLLDSMKNSGELDEIIREATLNVSEKLEEQITYFTDITCEKYHDNESSTDYYVTRIPKKHKLEIGIANDNLNLDTLESTLSFAKRKNATVCINAGVFVPSSKLPVGTVIKNYDVLYENIPSEEKYQFLGFTSNGEHKVFKNATSTSQMLARGIKDCICIFGSLIEKGIAIVQTDERREPRQSIGFDRDGNVIIVTCDGRTPLNEGMSYSDLVRVHTSLGSYDAYILDGGGSTSTVVAGVKQNINIDFLTDDRKVSTFIYVAKDSKVSYELNPNNLIGEVKQALLKEIINKLDFSKGYIRLRGPENYYAPGIEMYVNNEDTRRNKIGLSFDRDNQRNTYLYMSLKAGEQEKSNLFRIYDQGVWVQTYHGPSGSRPNGIVGLCYFDETLNKPIWYDGSKWVDSAGTNV